MRCSLLTLSSYLDGELDTAHRAEVDAHLVGCDRCHNALDYLREEVARISGLGRVHVPDAAAHSLLVRLGLLEAGDPLPRRASRPHTPVEGEAPPWLDGSASGAALPWTPRREPAPDGGRPSEPGRPSPTLDSGPRARAVPAPDEELRGVETVHLSGRSMPPQALGIGPGLQTLAGTELSDLPPSHRPDPLGTPPGPGWGPTAPHVVPAMPAPDPYELAPWAEPRGGSAASPAPSSPTRSDAAGGAAAAPPPSEPLWPMRGSEAPPPPAVSPEWPDPSPERGARQQPTASPEWRGARQQPTASPEWPAASPEWRVGGTGPQDPSAADGDWADPAQELGGHPAPSAAPVWPERAPPAPAQPPLTVAAWAADGWPAEPSEPSDSPAPPRAPRAPDAPPRARPVAGEPPDPLIDPLIDRVAATAPQPLRPSLVSRLRDQVALRLALRQPGGSVGAGRPARPVTGDDRSARTHEAPGHAAVGPAPSSPPRYGPSRGEGLGARPSANGLAFRPIGVPAGDVPPLRDAAEGPETADPWVPPRPRRPTVADELPRAPWIGPAEEPSGPVREPDAPRGRHTRGLASPRRPWDVAALFAPLVAALRGRPSGRRPAGRLNPRWLALAAVVLLVAIVLIVVMAGNGGAPTAAPTPSAPSGAVASAAPSTPQATSHPTASPSAAATATPRATPTPSASSSASAQASSPAAAGTAYGGTGSGWHVDGVTCCYVQARTGYTRIIFYLSGGTGGAPSATFGSPSGTSMLLTLTGAVTSSTFPQSSGGIVTAMTQSGPNSFQLTLKQPAQVAGWDFLANGDSSSSSPLLYFDLG